MKKKIHLLCYVFFCEIKSIKYLPMVFMWIRDNQNTPNKWFKLKIHLFEESVPDFYILSKINIEDHAVLGS